MGKGKRWRRGGGEREGGKEGGVATSRVQAFAHGSKMADTVLPIGARGAGRGLGRPVHQPPSACKHMEPPSCNLHASGQQNKRVGGRERGRVGVRALYLPACLLAHASYLALWSLDLASLVRTLGAAAPHIPHPTPVTPHPSLHTLPSPDHVRCPANLTQTHSLTHIHTNTHTILYDKFLIYGLLSVFSLSLSLSLSLSAPPYPVSDQEFQFKTPDLHLVPT